MELELRMKYMKKTEAKLFKENKAIRVHSYDSWMDRLIEHHIRWIENNFEQLNNNYLIQEPNQIDEDFYEFFYE